MTGPDLSEAEKRALRLLAHGYDIKGIAADLDISVHAVNERLRGARAKLGATSSRAAARQWAEREAGTQKSWDRKSGVPAAAEAGNSAGSARQSGRHKTKGVVAVLFAISLAAAAVFAFGHGTASVADAPRVVQTLPGNAAVIAPGAFELRVTFDRPMAPGSYSFVATGVAAYPECSGKPAQSADGRSFALQCTARAGTAYAVGFNRGRFRGFRAADDGRPAQPALLRFRAR